VETLRKVKTRRNCLLAPRGRLLLHLNVCSHRTGSLPSKLRKSWVSFQEKHLGQKALSHRRAPDRSSYR